MLSVDLDPSEIDIDESDDLKEENTKNLTSLTSQILFYPQIHIFDEFKSKPLKLPVLNNIILIIEYTTSCEVDLLNR